MSAVKMCESAGCTSPSTSRGAKFCKPCRKIRQSENGRIRGKKNAAAGIGHIFVGPNPRGIDFSDRRG